MISSIHFMMRIKSTRCPMECSDEVCRTLHAASFQVLETGSGFFFKFAISVYFTTMPIPDSFVWKRKIAWRMQFLLVSLPFKPNASTIQNNVFIAGGAGAQTAFVYRRLQQQQQQQKHTPCGNFNLESHIEMISIRLSKYCPCNQQLLGCLCTECLYSVDRNSQLDPGHGFCKTLFDKMHKMTLSGIKRDTKFCFCIEEIHLILSVAVTETWNHISFMSHSSIQE